MSDEHPLDGVALAILSSRMQGVVRAMLNTLARTGRSGVLNTARDFSCCILTADCELLSMAESLPIHVMRGPDLMAQAMKDFFPVLRAGDAFLHNSPYHGNSHAADHCILVPVVDCDGEHRLTVLVKAHQADCGNATPSTYSAAARDVYDEGALIFPCVRVQKDHRDCEDIMRMCRARIRVPEQWWGDYLAMIGAARIGEQQLLEIGREVGWQVLEEYAEAWFDYSEGLMRDAIAQLPAGVVSAESAHDPFPGVPAGIPVRVTVRVRPREGMIDVDLTDNPDCQPCGLNLTEATSLTAAMIGIFNSIPAAIPPNAGSFRRIDVALRENCTVGIPRHPASCSVATTNLADRVTNPVQRAMADLADGVGMGEAGLVQPPAWAVLSGQDPRRGGPFVNQVLFPSATGGPGGPLNDGWLTMGHVGNAGMMFRDSVEMDEIHHPMRVEAQYILPDTEGAGRRRGAPGAYLEYGPVGGPMEVVYVSDGTVNPALGARGGLAGSRAEQYRRRRDGELEALDACAQVELTPGETIISVSCGGGGYGPPTERDPEAVLHDVRERWVTTARARDVYGVVIDEQGSLDVGATDRLRRSLVPGPEEASDGR
jgi:N-methylhydantoinase B